MTDFGNNLLVALLILLPAASLAGWLYASARWIGGRPVVAFQPRRAVPWGLADLAVIMAALVLLQGVALALVREGWGVSLGTPLYDLPATQQIALLTASAVAQLLALAASWVWLRWRTGANAQDLGVDIRQLASDCHLGAIGFVMLVVPVFGVQYGLTQWMGLESKHPLVKLVQENPQPWFFLCSGVAAIVVAPVAEEYLFRVFLQGWLENVAAGLRSAPSAGEAWSRWARQWMLGPLLNDLATRRWHHEPTQAPPETPDAEPIASQSLTTTSGPESVNPYESPTDDVQPTAPLVAGRLGEQVGPAYWPILVSAALFASAHVGHGTDPIPLFLLAVGLGYLYQRTHRVTPCIVVHLLVNALSMLQLWVLSGQA